MFRMFESCKTCNNVTELKPGECRQRDTFCGHIQQAKTIEGAVNLVNQGGEFPCSFSPVRKEFIKLINNRKRQDGKISFKEIKQSIRTNNNI